MFSAAQQLTHGIVEKLELPPSHVTELETAIGGMIKPGGAHFATAIKAILSLSTYGLDAAGVSEKLQKIVPYTDAAEIICREDRPAIYNDEGLVRHLDPQTDDLFAFCQAADLYACYQLLAFVHAGVPDALTDVLDHTSSMIAVARQFEVTLAQCEKHPPHTPEFQDSWRVLPDLHEDAEQSGLLLMAELLSEDVGIAVWLGAAKMVVPIQQAASLLICNGLVPEGALTDRPPELDAIISAETLPAAPVIPKLRKGLSAFLTLQDMVHEDWPERFATVQCAAEQSPSLATGGRSQAGGYVAAGLAVTLLRQSTGIDGEPLCSLTGAADMVPTGMVMCRNADGVVVTQARSEAAGVGTQGRDWDVGFSC